MATDPREPYGRLVHDTRLAAEADRAAAEGRQRFRLGEWDERDEFQCELDMRIGSAIAARAVADAGAADTRRDAQLFALRSHLPAILDALSRAVADSEYDAQAKPFRAALEALGGGERPS
jgi:hypothetical protein